MMICQPNCYSRSPTTYELKRTKRNQVKPVVNPFCSAHTISLPLPCNLYHLNQNSKSYGHISSPEVFLYTATDTAAYTYTIPMPDSSHHRSLCTAIFSNSASPFPYLPSKIPSDFYQIGQSRKSHHKNLYPRGVHLLLASPSNIFAKALAPFPINKAKTWSLPPTFLYYFFHPQASKHPPFRHFSLGNFRTSFPHKIYHIKPT